MADEIRLVTYANQQVTPQNDAVLTNLETPNNGIIFGCEISIKNASTLHINSGMGVIYGREFEIVDSDISVPLPGAGTEVGQLYIHIDLANTSEPIQILVETGASLTPLVDDANLNITTGITEYQLATFNVSTATISDLVVTFENTKDIRTELGDADISGIGDGSVKGAISRINSDLIDLLRNGNGYLDNQAVNENELKVVKTFTVPKNMLVYMSCRMIYHFLGTTLKTCQARIKLNGVPWYGYVHSTDITITPSTSFIGFLSAGDILELELFSSAGSTDVDVQWFTNIP